MERWSAKIAVVTGASSGIGEAITKDLVKHGMKVAALARRDDRLKDLEKELNKPGYIKGIKCDVSKEDEVKDAIKWIESNWGEIHVLVNNAGVAKLEPLLGGTGEGVRTVFETNVIGLSTCARLVCDVMKRNKIQEGHIININSVVGHYIPLFPGISPYSASKHAVTAISKIWKFELAKEKLPVRVTSVSPGLVVTEMTQKFSQLDIPKLQPKDVSSCIIFALGTPQNVNISEITVEPTGDVPPGNTSRLSDLLKEK